MYFVVVALLDAGSACRVDMPAGEAGWKCAEVLVVCLRLFAMADPVEGIAVREADPPEEAPLRLGDRMARAQGLVVEN